jgi:hypothetical protein
MSKYRVKLEFAQILADGILNRRMSKPMADGQGEAGWVFDIQYTLKCGEGYE